LENKINKSGDETSKGHQLQQPPLFSIILFHPCGFLEGAQVYARVGDVLPQDGQVIPIEEGIGGRWVCQRRSPEYGFLSWNKYNPNNAGTLFHTLYLYFTKNSLLWNKWAGFFQIPTSE
jgi:hypothetical protein